MNVNLFIRHYSDYPSKVQILRVFICLNSAGSIKCTSSVIKNALNEKFILFSEYTQTF